MAFLTETAARTAFQSGRATKAVIESELRKSAASAPSTVYDVFLSHSSLDADVIAGIQTLLASQGLRVYVDWLEDPQADRTKVTAKTAEMLRGRMRNSRSLIFATSETSSRSRWMPWELGYFDGFRTGHVAILPLVKNSTDPFVGQEYLGLYPYFELISNLGSPQLAIRTPGSTRSVKSFAAGT